MINIQFLQDERKIRDLLTEMLRVEYSHANAGRGELYRSIFRAMEKPLIEHVLSRTDGNQLKAAKILGINRNTMRTKIRKLGIDPKTYK